MCRFVSFVLTKDKVLWLPNGIETVPIDRKDSHEEIIKHWGLHPDGVRGPNILRVELVPGPQITRLDDYHNWFYRVDQDIFPEWHDNKYDEERTRDALPERFKCGLEYVDARGCTALTELKAERAEYVYT